LDVACRLSHIISPKFIIRTDLATGFQPLDRLVAAATQNLTLPCCRRKSNASVRPLTANVYAQWRGRNGLGPALREGADRPSERLLQLIWQHQRLIRDRLVLVDGRRLQVLHPGFWNQGAGPDFRAAVLQFDGQAPLSGDVEIDLASSGWQAHRHDRNPAFAAVRLHVVWEADTTPTLPTLVVQHLLDSPVSDLALWLSSDAAQLLPCGVVGRCAAPFTELTPAQRTELLQQAALVRLYGKAAQFHARARQAGWEQALWEGLFRALGYKHNVWPMQRLAELRLRLVPPDSRMPVWAVQARLLGTAGLLPTELPTASPATARYLRRLWDWWWRERDSFSDCILPASLWRLGGLRPANHPARRLALVAHWLAAGDLAARLETWCQRPLAAGHPADSLLVLLPDAHDEFWSWHWTLRSPRLAKPQPLLGAARATDLAVNVILPWLWIRAVEGRQQALQQELQRRYLAWPRSQDNAVLRLARRRLFGDPGAVPLRTAAEQQGLLQIARDFCDQSDALCTQCPMPSLVQDWQRTGAG
jgi:hypothetical protein